MKQTKKCPKCKKKVGWSQEFEAKEIRAFNAKGGMAGSDWISTMIIGDRILHCRECGHDISDLVKA